MTKHRDVNKCRRKEKCKMAALISGYEMARERKKEREKKKKKTHGGKEEEKREKTKTTLSEKKEEARNVSEQRDKGWIHVTRVHDTIA